ncbi:flagellar export chaperone FliS [Oleispirillum naphthae]|uniref:flagellar export chaperone FliS n=1 Tax=Oleispirillum naphthae TaxID=2838853 RepID=UPI00308225E8
MTGNIHEMGAKAYGAARRTQTPLRIIVELYDSVLCAVAHAKAACLQDDFEGEFNAIIAATKILQGLDGALNQTDPKARPIAEMLHDYYKTTIVQLHRAKQAKSPESELRYGSVQRQVLAMREAFAAIAGVPSLVVEAAEKSA